jgi:hypothetical protein
VEANETGSEQDPLMRACRSLAERDCRKLRSFRSERSGRLANDR